MHLEILVEDASGKKMLDGLMPRLLGEAHTFNIKSYKGIGRVPKGLSPCSDPNKRILLDQLPRLLTGYGKAFAAYGSGYSAAVMVVCDLDKRSRDDFESELKALVEKIVPLPKLAFCLAIEEVEAWLLGDFPAIKKAYPNAKDAILNSYVNDSICGTWEVLANAIFSGGADALRSKGWMEVGAQKSKWAETITPHMSLTHNQSPSFNEFIATLGHISGH